MYNIANDFVGQTRSSCKIIEFMFYILVFKGKKLLEEAFELMKNVAETRPSIDTPDPFGADLYVLCAETAFKVRVSRYLSLKFVVYKRVKTITSVTTYASFCSLDCQKCLVTVSKCTSCERLPRTSSCVELTSVKLSSWPRHPPKTL